MFDDSGDDGYNISNSDASTPRWTIFLDFVNGSRVFTEKHCASERFTCFFVNMDDATRCIQLFSQRVDFQLHLGHFELDEFNAMVVVVFDVRRNRFAAENTFDRVFWIEFALFDMLVICCVTDNR